MATQPKGKSRSTMLRRALSKLDSFPNLPLELRFLIWRYACFVPRDVDIWMQHQGEVQLNQIAEYKQNPVALFLPHSYHSRSIPPAILQVNQESRREGLRWYQPEFGTNMKIGGLSYVLPARIYINWKVDRLCVMDHSCISRPVKYSGISFADLCCKKRLQVLALNLSNSHPLGPLSKEVGLSLRKMGLKELILFHDASYKHHANFRLEPFQMRNKDGKLSKVAKAPLTLTSCPRREIRFLLPGVRLKQTRSGWWLKIRGRMVRDVKTSTYRPDQRSP